MNKMNTYQEMICKSRYSRYLPNELRREHWSETTDRWISFWRNRLPDPNMGLPWDLLRDSILNLEVLPSMRSIMTAGPALERTHVAGYNCAYLPVDHPYSFDEAMYILLCGTGVGFSVEQQYVSQLPTIPQYMRFMAYVIDVEDSKEGWCNAYRELLDCLWRGIIPLWDVSRVRPAGAPLKTFGGRASGPDPLVSLFEYTVEKFKNAAGRPLYPLEAHDIMCKIGEVVVVGGVRRSAMISLGDLSDFEHRAAKSSGWWEHSPERALSNNSAVYHERPDMGRFMNEWTSIYESKSGERGIFNRQASQIQAAKYGRRPEDIDYGTNPCSEIILRPYQFCNLSTAVIQPHDEQVDIVAKIATAALMGTMQASLTNFPYLRPIWEKNTKEEALLGVSMTGILGNFRLFDQDAHSSQFLDQLRNVAGSVNRRWAPVFGINDAAAITCVKPEGTVSQLTLTKSGIHAGHAPFYIRRVRQDNKDPLTQFLISKGVPNEPCVMKPNDTTVFSFPMKEEGLTRNDLTAKQHLDIWLDFQRHYCEHKPSVTISVKEDEWMEVGAWVYKHFDECTGVSFLPDDGGSYRQAPYEDITEEVYDKMVAEMPTIDWNDFVEFDDQVVGSQTLACTAGQCSI